MEQGSGEYGVSRVSVGGEMSGGMRSGVRGLGVQTVCGWEWRRVTNVKWGERGSEWGSEEECEWMSVSGEGSRTMRGV